MCIVCIRFGGVADFDVGRRSGLTCRLDGKLMPLIELNALSRSFVDEGGEPVHALRSVSLCIEEGEFVCVTGASGSGKSTLLNILGCLDRPSGGSYRFAGLEVQGLNPATLTLLRRRAFGFVFQSYNLLDTATTIENVALPGRYAGMSSGARKKRAEQLLTFLGLEERAEHLPSELSGGEQQRTSIGRALMNGGQVILADEPTAALDRTSGAQVLAALEEIARRGRTVLLTTQDSEIARRAPRRIELVNGRVASDSGTQSRSVMQLPSVMKPDTPNVADRMGLLEAIRTGFDSLHAATRSGNRLRMAALAIGACIAVWLGSLALLLGEGGYARTVSAINQMGLERIVVLPNPERKAGRGAFTWLTLDDARAIEVEIANVRAVSPLKLSRRIFVRQGEFSGEFAVQGVVDQGTREGRGPHGYRLADGEFITPQDDGSMERVAVLDSVARNRLFPRNTNPVGKEILIRGTPFRVKGVNQHRLLETRRMPEQSQEEIRASEEVVNGWIYIPFRTFYALLAEHAWLYGIYVHAKSPDDLFDVANEIRELGVRRHGDDVYYVEHAGGALQDAKRQRRQMRLGFGTLAILVLAATNSSVMALMLAAVSARRREIGIRMAVGAGRRDIFWQFFTEVLALGLSGSVIGAMLVLLFMPLLNWLGFPVAVTYFVWLPFACALAFALIFGVLPALRAANLNPTAALTATG